jgi:hypothetical protein
MLTRWIVGAYKTLLEIALWASTLIGGLSGAVGDLGPAEGLFGFVIGAAITFFGMAIFLGAALVLVDIHERVKAIENHVKSKGGTAG